MTVKNLEEQIVVLNKNLESVLSKMKEDRQKAIEDRQRATVALESIATFFQTQQHNIAENIAEKNGEKVDTQNKNGEKDDTQNSNGNNGRVGTAPIIRASQINLKFPVFNGTDPEGWIFKAEQYFSLVGVQEAKKVSMAAVHLEGDSISWYRWISSSLGQLTWEQFSHTIRARFSSRKYTDPCASLSKLGQTGSAREFITEFEKLLNFVPDMPESHQISIFLSGLREDISAGVRMLRPSSLSEAFDLAIRQEEAIDATSRFKATKSIQAASKPVTTTTSTTVPVRRISKFEQEERRKQGLCFHCDEAYTPGHLCKRAAQVLLLEADDDVFIVNYSNDPT